jgi:hypothetical protein
MRALAALTILIACLCQPHPAEAEVSEAFALERAVAELAAEAELWPGFDPLGTPLAVFDGTDTYLFRHPAPPEGFAEAGGAYVFEGRHPAVVANSSAWIGDVATATVWLGTFPEEYSPTDRAALVLHEAFHVFQGTTERRWGADESQLFMYPTDDAGLLALRRLETEALRRAFEAPDDAAVAGWAALALAIRRERFDTLDAGFSAYERGIELMEGTATYVEYGASGRTSPALPPEGFEAADVRARGYRTGVAWALLLDRFVPDWRGGFDTDDRDLDAVLAHALAGAAAPAECAFTDEERAAVSAAAREDVGRLLADRVRRREEFDSKPGWRLAVAAEEGSPLWLRGFDPLNVERVEGGLLHTRFLKLGNDSGTAEVMSDTVLTEGAGQHPIFDGVRRMTLAGIEDEPAIEVDGEAVTVRLPTFSAEFVGATVERSERRITISLKPGNE